MSYEIKMEANRLRGIFGDYIEVIECSEELIFGDDEDKEYEDGGCAYIRLRIYDIEGIAMAAGFAQWNPGEEVFAHSFISYEKCKFEDIYKELISDLRFDIEYSYDKQYNPIRERLIEYAKAALG